MTTHLKPLICAWQFLTAVPVSRDFHDPAPDELAGSMLWYPFVGILLGGLLATTDVFLARWLPREAVAALLIRTGWPTLWTAWPEDARLPIA